MYTSVFQCTLFPARTLGLAHSFENTSKSDKNKFSMKIKYFVLIWFFTTSTYCQKCKKPKVHYTLYINEFNGKQMLRVMLVIQSRTRIPLATKGSALLLARKQLHGSDILICELSQSSNIL